MWRLRLGRGKEELMVSKNNFHGRRYWEYDPEAGTEEERAQVEKARSDYRSRGFKNGANLLMRMQLRKESGVEVAGSEEVPEEEEVVVEVVTKRLKKGIDYFSTLQLPDGHWPSDLPGIMFLGPLITMALYITGDLHNVFSSQHIKEMRRYIYNHQNEDGGWGMHAEGESNMFGSVVSYVAFRLLGAELINGEEEEESMAATRGQKWILDHGGAVGIPSWGKYWLAVLGVYEWSGCNPIVPEIWLLPNFVPFHPGKLLSFARLVYLPLSYLFGKRFVGRITELILSLRHELYIEPYNSIDWNKARNTCAKEDRLREPSKVIKWTMSFLWKMETILTRWPGSLLREKALKLVMEHIYYEDINSSYLCIGSVEKALSLIACWVEDPNSKEYKYHLPRIHDYLWVSEDGMTMLGNLSQVWDVALAAQAIISNGLTREYHQTLARAYEYIKETQIHENPSGNYRKMYRQRNKGSWAFMDLDQAWQVSDCTAEALKIHENPSGNYRKMYRQRNKGSWAFMDLDQAWQVSDCTAEALKVAFMLSQVLGEEFNKEYAYDAVDFLLDYQSANGGISAWEPARAYRWVEEVISPIEFLEDALIEREYVECTSSVVQAFVYFSILHPDYRKMDIKNCISKAINYLENSQLPDGSWYGRWGVCFTYGTWFAVEAFVACGKSFKNSPHLQKACKFLLSKQLPCGGWGESYLSCHNKVYTNLRNDHAHVVHTSWALLALMKAGQAEIDPTPIHRGIKVLIDFQMIDGDFPQQEAAGCFMRYYTLNYSSYRYIFAIWALAEYTRLLNG